MGCGSQPLNHVRVDDPVRDEQNNLTQSRLWRNLGFGNYDDYILLMTNDRHFNETTAPRIGNDMKEHTDTRIVIPYPKESKDAELHPKPIYREVSIVIWSSGGKASAKQRRLKSHLHPVILGDKE